jgi:hypothetical protein
MVYIGRVIRIKKRYKKMKAGIYTGIVSGI